MKINSLDFYRVAMAEKEVKCMLIALESMLHQMDVLATDQGQSIRAVQEFIGAAETALENSLLEFERYLETATL